MGQNRAESELNRAQTRIKLNRQHGKQGGRPPNKINDISKANGSGGQNPNYQLATNNYQLTTEETKKDAAVAASQTDEADLYRRGKRVLGDNAGGMIKNLLRAKDGNVALARSAIETASTKSSPREYIGAIIRSRDAPPVEQLWDPRL